MTGFRQKCVQRGMGVPYAVAVAVFVGTAPYIITSMEVARL